MNKYAVTHAKIFLVCATVFFVSSALSQVVMGFVNRPQKIEVSAKPVGINDNSCSVLITFPDGIKKYFTHGIMGSLAELAMVSLSNLLSEQFQSFL